MLLVGKRKRQRSPQQRRYIAGKMDREEAKGILVKELELYRQRSYNDLVYLVGAQDTTEIKAPSGIVYQLEFQATWDDKKNGNLRVMGTIDDGGFRAFFPLTHDFIIAPNGTFVGE